MLPLLAFLPLCWIVIRWAVRRSFWPLIRLQSEIGTRGGTNLAQIPDLDFPTELLPIHTYHLMPRPLKVIVGDPISTAGLTTRDADALTQRLYEVITAAYMEHHRDNSTR